jgi:DNA-binding transcriptional LysR family regulator
MAVSQPAISQAITDLERVLGVRLLDRSRHGVEPTRYGIAFLKWSAVIFDNLKQGVEEIDYLTDPTAGEVRVGTIEITIAGLVPHIIIRLSRQYPRLTFTVMQAATRAMMHCDLRDRSVDFIFGRIAMPNTEGDLDVEFLFDDPLVAVVGASSKWLRRRKVDAAELINEPWCLPPFDWYAEAAGSAIPEAFRARGLTVPRHTVKSNSGNLFFSLVAAGPYISALPASIIRLNGKRLGIRGLPFEFPIRPDPVCIATLSTCQKLAIKIVSAEVRAPSDLDAAFRAFANDHVQAVIVLVDGMLFDERNRIAALAAATQLPAIYGFRDHVDAGGLASYGVNCPRIFIARLLM